jgi:hypothetical protein
MRANGQGERGSRARLWRSQVWPFLPNSKAPAAVDAQIVKND